MKFLLGLESFWHFEIVKFLKVVEIFILDDGNKNC